MPADTLQPQPEQVAQQQTNPVANAGINVVPQPGNTQPRLMTQQEILQQQRNEMLRDTQDRINALDVYSLARERDTLRNKSKALAEKGDLENATDYKAFADYADNRRELLNGLMGGVEGPKVESGSNPLKWVGSKLKKLWRNITPQGKKKWYWGLGAAVGTLESAAFTLLFGPAGGWVKAGVNALILNTVAWNKELFDKKGNATKMGSFVSGLAGSSLLYAGYKMFTEPVIAAGSPVTVQDVYNQNAVDFKNSVIGTVSDTRSFIMNDLVPSVQKGANDMWRLITTGQLPADYVAPSTSGVGHVAAAASGGGHSGAFQEMVIKPGQMVEPTLRGMGWSNGELKDAFLGTLKLNPQVFTDGRFNASIYPNSAGIASGILNGSLPATLPNLYQSLGSIYTNEVIKFPNPN